MAKKFWVILVSLALVSGAGYLGWRAYDQNQKTKNQQTQNDPSEGGKYLVIKEWGVRFLLPEELRGDIYYIEEKDKEYETVSIRSRSVDLDNCAPIAVIRTQKENLGNVQVGDKYFGFVEGVQLCEQQTDPREANAARVEKKIYQALHSLEAIK